MEPDLSQLIRVTENLTADLASLRFAEPVRTVMNPLVHAHRSHRRYLERFGTGRKRVLFLGMNPGPWGMTQTGVPFGEIEHVREWMGIDEVVDKPANEHPKRPVTGFDCPRSEVSGRRFWGWAKARFGKPEAFFSEHFVLNWCPLIFLEESGRNRTPDKLPVAERKALEAVCDGALTDFVALYRPELVLGVGKYAARRAEIALPGSSVRIDSVPHPSPASPAANRGWAELMDGRMAELGETS